MTSWDDGIEFDIPDELWWLLSTCEKQCVAGCCGLRAFDFSPQVLREGIAILSPDKFAAARRQLDELIEQVKAIPGDVDTLMIRETWTGPDAARWFSHFRMVLDAVVS